MITLPNNDYWLKQQADENPNRTAVIENDEKYSYRELFELASKASVYFSAKGIKRGDHASIISANNIEFIITINALWFLGVIPVPLNVRLNNFEIQKLIKHSKSKFLISLNTNLKEIIFKRTVVFSLENLISVKGNISESRYLPGNIALMMYSSGSTGKPKCVQITFNNLYESCKSADNFINHTINDVWLASLPFYHIGGFSIFTRALIAGCSVVLSNSVNSKSLIEKIEMYKPSLISIVPTMLKEFLERNFLPWKELRIAFLGGGPIDKTLLNKALKNNWQIAVVYGSTETTSMVTVASPINLKRNGLSAGKNLSDVIINLVDEKKNFVPNGKIGEIVVESNSVALRYYNPSEEYSSKFIKKSYYTGDIGKIDVNGNLQVIGRKDDIIISGGENINLSEIENFVKTLRQVSECTTIKIKDKKWGESYILLVVLNKKNENTKNIILKELKTNISGYKQPKTTLFLDSLYRNELGKIDKSKIKNLPNIFSKLK